MRKILIILLCTTLCLPFISCSNDSDGIDNETLTRSETIESQYQETIDKYSSSLANEGFPAQNKYSKELLIGSWEAVAETAEVYRNEEAYKSKVKEDGRIAIKSIDMEEALSVADYVVSSRKDELHQVVIIKDSIQIVTSFGDNFIDYKNHWEYTYNHLVDVDIRKTKEELVKEELALMPWLENNEFFMEAMSVLPVPFLAEVLDLSNNNMILKVVTSFPNATTHYGRYEKPTPNDPIAFSIIEYKRIK